MAPNFIGPYFVNIGYRSPLAPHSMTVPTKNWNPGGSFGTFDTWSGGTIQADDMIVNLITLMLPWYTALSTFDSAIIYKQLLPADTPQPVMSIGGLGLAGTGVHTGWAGATEIIFIARSSTFGIAKLVLLDSLTDGVFTPITAFTGDYAGLFGEWGLDANGWCARDNGQVISPLKVTKNLNQKLRKEYHYD
jgi:hypothetical protein